MGEVRPQDKDSGLVFRSSYRPLKGHPEIVTEESMEGDHVVATFPRDYGTVRRVEGEVIRDDQGTLVIRSFKDGSEVPVPRWAYADVRTVWARVDLEGLPDAAEESRDQERSQHPRS